VRSFVHIKGSDLTFVEEGDCWRTAKFEVRSLSAITNAGQAPIEPNRVKRAEALQGNSGKRLGYCSFSR